MRVVWIFLLDVIHRAGALVYPIEQVKRYESVGSGKDWVSPVLETFEKIDNLYCIEGCGLEVFLLRDFLTPDECNHLRNLIDEENFPSRLMGPASQNFRTSHSSPLSACSDPLIRELDQRISDLTGIPLENQEGMEGQRYRVGQEFKPHFDAFLPDHAYYPVELAAGGQRTWTVMLALNQPKAGGGTAFPTARLRINPRAGNLIAWSSLNKSGGINTASLHCGEPVVAGSKYVVTKWHREFKFTPERKQKKIKKLKQFGLLENEWKEDRPPPLRKWGRKSAVKPKTSGAVGVK